jgi:ATP-dependent protease ClpP protease subunit
MPTRVPQPHPPPEKKELNMPNANDAIPEIAIYDVIYSDFGVGPKDVRDQLAAFPGAPTIRVRLNSPGGSIFDGLAIYNILKSNPAKIIVTVDGFAASIASLIAMAGDEIEMGSGAMLMIHNPACFAGGESEDMRFMADLLDKTKSQLLCIYAERTRQPADKLSALMDAETWLTYDEAKQLGFVDRSVAAPAIAAQYGPSPLANVAKVLANFSHVPDAIRNHFTTNSLLNTGVPNMANTATQITNETPLQLHTVAATIAELKNAMPKADADFLLKQLETGATLGQAQNAYAGELSQQLEKAQKEIADLKAKIEAQPANKKPGVAALGNGASLPAAREETGNPTDLWNAAVQRHVAAGKPKAKAIRDCVRENPELHQQYLEACRLAK